MGTKVIIGVEVELDYEFKRFEAIDGDSVCACNEG